MKEIITWQKAGIAGSAGGAMYFLIAIVMDYLNHGIIAWPENFISSAIFAVLVVFIWKNKIHIKKRINKKRKIY